MKIVVAMDSFKGSLTARAACEAVREGLRQARPDIEVQIKPMADGGEGTSEALIAARYGEWISSDVTGPLPDRRVTAGYAWFPDRREALVEMATASGLPLLRPDEYNPLKTTTFGTGELLALALEREPERLYLAVGGSATVDGGVGAATALGWRFLDDKGKPVPLGGGGLECIVFIEPPARSITADVEVLCDVKNPLTGPRGAAAVFAPQKGATPEMVKQLERGLAHLAHLVKEHTGTDLDVPGAGAAGGLAAGAIAFMNARLVPGIETVMTASGLDQALEGADWVITGEGCFDGQSIHGKVVSGIASRAGQAGVRVAVLAGSVELSEAEYVPEGIRVAIASKGKGVPLEEALRRAGPLLEEAARYFAADHL